MKHEVEIGEMRREEHEEWLSLREFHWPESTREFLAGEQAEIVEHRESTSVLAARLPGGGIVGFAEVSLRDWAEGCTSRPVGYLEAWYVRPEYRRSGIGRELLQGAEAWARSRGCTEMGSDAEVPNTTSQAAHRALGYTEVIRLVLFSKKLTP